MSWVLCYGKATSGSGASFYSRIKYLYDPSLKHSLHETTIMSFLWELLYSPPLGKCTEPWGDAHSHIKDRVPLKTHFHFNRAFCVQFSKWDGGKRNNLIIFHSCGCRMYLRFDITVSLFQL